MPNLWSSLRVEGTGRPTLVELVVHHPRLSLRHKAFTRKKKELSLTHHNCPLEHLTNAIQVKVNDILNKLSEIMKSIHWSGQFLSCTVQIKTSICTKRSELSIFHRKRNTHCLGACLRAIFSLHLLFVFMSLILICVCVCVCRKHLSLPGKVGRTCQQTWNILVGLLGWHRWRWRWWWPPSHWKCPQTWHEKSN